MTVKKRTRTYTYHTRGSSIVARKRGKKESEIQKELKRQARAVRKSLH